LSNVILQTGSVTNVGSLEPGDGLDVRNIVIGSLSQARVASVPFVRRPLQLLVHRYAAATFAPAKSYADHHKHEQENEQRTAIRLDKLDHGTTSSESTTFRRKAQSLAPSVIRWFGPHRAKPLVASDALLGKITVTSADRSSPTSPPIETRLG
jgi:hypothetical protein